VETVSLEPAMLEIAPITGTLKESVQKGQQLVWFGKGDPNDRRFQATNMSVAFLRNEATGGVKMTFAANISAFGYRPVDEAKLNVIVRTKSGRLFIPGILPFRSDAPIKIGRLLQSPTTCRTTSPPMSSPMSAPSKLPTIGSQITPE
jgi:hypothetical protein